MRAISLRWLIIAAFGHGVLLTLAMTGAVRIVAQSLGHPLPDNVAGNLFLPGSLLFGSGIAYCYARSRQRATARAHAQANG